MNKNMQLPMLVKEISLSETDQGRWVLRTGEGRHILLNQATATLVQLLQEHNGYEAATHAFNRHFNTTLSTDAFSRLVYDKLSGYQVLAGEENSKPYKKGKYLQWQIPFFSAPVAGALSVPFRPLFAPRLFLMTMVVLVGISAWALVSYPPAQAFIWPEINLLLLACLVYPSVLIHELGHIAACRAAGTAHGEIGFGLYLIFPVLYSDVTNIWQAQKKQRIIVNLAGIANELLYATSLLLIFHFTGNITLLAAFYLIQLKVLFELNPFIRMDGYWTFSDITNTPNLLPKANKQVKAVLGRLFSRNGSRHATEGTNKWLFLYGITNMSAIFIYTGYMLYSHFDNIVHFPAIIADLFMKALRLELSFHDLKREYLFVFIFYWITGRILYQLIKRNSRVVSAKLNRVAY